MTTAAPPAGVRRALRARWPWLALAALLLLAALHALWFKQLQDFGVFFRAGARALEGSRLYRLEDGVECFKYAPAVALLFIPLALLPFKLSALLWLLGSTACLLVFWRWSARTFAPEAGPLWHLLVLLWVAPYLRYLLALGQSDLLVLALLLSSQLLRGRRPLASGLLWAGCCLFKLPFLVFVPLALLYREWRRLSGLLLGLAVGVALPVLRYGGEALGLHADWRALLAATTPEMICSFDNQSLFGMVCRYAAQPGSAAFQPLALGLGAALFAGAAWMILRSHREDAAAAQPLGFALGLYLAALLSPLGWRSNLVALLPLLYLLRAEWRALSPLARTALAGLATLNTFIGLVAYDVVGKDAFRWLVERRAIGLVALLFVAGLLAATRGRKVVQVPTISDTGAQQ